MSIGNDVERQANWKCTSDWRDLCPTKYQLRLKIWITKYIITRWRDRKADRTINYEARRRKVSHCQAELINRIVAGRYWLFRKRATRERLKSEISELEICKF